MSKFFTKNSLGEAIDSRQNNLNALRLLAASLVIIEHIQVIWLGNDHPVPSLGNLSHSTFALFMFFFTSGVLITQSVANAPDLKTYIVARILRIYPALLFLMAVCMLIIGPMVAVGPYWSDPDVFRFPANVVTFGDTRGGPPGFFPNNPIPHEFDSPLWTLRYEVMLYTAAAILPILGFLRRTYLVHVGTIGLALTMIVTNAPIDPVFGSTTLGWLISFGFCFFLGTSVWLTRYQIEGKIIYLLAAIIAFALTVQIGAGTSVTAVLLVAAFVNWSAISKPLPVVKKHDISYGVYIWHYPIAQILVGFGLVSSIWVLGAMTFILTIIISTLSWLFIERPAMRLKKTLLAKKVEAPQLA